MPKFIDLTGQRFNKLLVVERTGQDQHGRTLWRCVCDCGGEAVVSVGNLRSGNSGSCGCVKRSVLPDSTFKHGHAPASGHTPTYRSWVAMRNRCTRPTDKQWHNYGGRGITVCARWLNSFEKFLADMGERPEGKTLDRVDTSKGYSKSNCRWATASEQARNRRNSSMPNLQGVIT